MKAIHESIIIEVVAQRKGDDVYSDGGLFIGKREMGEIPKHGKVISIGDDVPEFMLGKKVVIPEGRMTNVPDPRAVDGTLMKGELPRQLVATHWKNIQVTY